MTTAGPTRIEPEMVERVWGALDLTPWYPRQSAKTGEVWFDSGDILVKFIFTTGNLSVQVHPGDDYAASHHNGSAGKTEMWHILRADPGARIAIGFQKPVTLEAARQGALDGSIVSMLAWHEAAPGDTFFTPAGTVHAIGAGLVLCEIQQKSDVTYRLYDWGRTGRPLHLDDGFAVAALGTHPGRSTPGDDGTLARCPYFTTEKQYVRGVATWPRDALMIVLEGEGSVDGAACAAGQVWRLPQGANIASSPGMTLLRTYVEA
ncbi:MAG: class I mannose-6-phosphate isomerase [Bryobacteraceae bacterium]